MYSPAPDLFVWKDPRFYGSLEPTPGCCNFKLQRGPHRDYNRYCKGRPLKGERYCYKHQRVYERFMKIRKKEGKEKQNFYTDSISLQDLSVYDDIPLGSLDDEIRLMRLQLRRMLKVQQIFLDALIEGKCDDNGNIVIEVEWETAQIYDKETNTLRPGPVATKRIKRKNDFTSEIEKITKLIGNLENLRNNMNKNKPETDNPNLTQLIQVLSGIRGGEITPKENETCHAEIAPSMLLL